MKMTLSIAAFGFLVVSQIAAAAAEPAAVWPASEEAAAAAPAKRHESLLAVAGDAAAPAPVRAHWRCSARVRRRRRRPRPWRPGSGWPRIPPRRRGTATRPAGALRKSRRGQGGRSSLPEAALGAARTCPCSPPLRVVLHIAHPGDDAGGGTETAPLATLAGARNAVRKQGAGPRRRPASGRSAGCHARRDVSRLRDVQRLGPEDSGTATALDRLSGGGPGETPVLAGGVPQIGDWRPLSDEAMKRRLEQGRPRAGAGSGPRRALGVRDFGDATNLAAHRSCSSTKCPRRSHAGPTRDRSPRARSWALTRSKSGARSRAAGMGSSSTSRIVPAPGSMNPTCRLLPAIGSGTGTRSTKRSPPSMPARTP